MKNVRFRYNHDVWPGIRRWLFYVVTLNALFALPMLLARTYGFAPSDLALVRAGYLGGTLLAIVVASGMFYRFTRTSEITLDATHMVMPHYLWPSVQLARITAVHVDQRQPGVVLLGVQGQLPRYIRAGALSPATTAEALAACVRTAISGIDTGKARQLEHASLLAVRSRGMPWACLCLAASWLLVHTIAWHSGSRFDDLDLLASGAYLHSLVLQGDVTRVLAASFLHAHVPHLLANTATLLMLGSVLERILRWHILLATFVASSAVAVAGSGWLAPGLLHVGASGGLFGLIGALIHLRISRSHELPAGVHALPLWLLLGVTALSLGVFKTGMDWMAHALGLAAGLCLAPMTLGKPTAGRFHAQADAALHAARNRHTPQIVPIMLAVGAITCAAFGLVDAARRTTALGHASRLATLNHLATSHPDLDALNAVAWRSVVIEGNFPSSAGPLIAAFGAREPLIPAHRDTLAALYFIAGSARKAADEQLAALLASTTLPQETQEAMAARLATYVQRTGTVHAWPQLQAQPSTRHCTRVVDVTGTLGAAVTVRVRFVPAGSASTAGHVPAGHAYWIASSGSDCSPESRTWSLATIAPGETERVSRYDQQPASPVCNGNAQHKDCAYPSSARP